MISLDDIVSSISCAITVPAVVYWVTGYFLPLPLPPCIAPPDDDSSVSEKSSPWSCWWFHLCYVSSDARPLRFLFWRSGRQDPLWPRSGTMAACSSARQPGGRISPEQYLVRLRTVKGLEKQTWYKYYLRRKFIFAMCSPQAVNRVCG